MGKEFYLNKLIGKSVTKTGMGTSTTFPIGESTNDPKNQRTEITLELFFGDYYLEIYNPITILPPNNELSDLIGLQVIATEEKPEEAELVFDNGYILRINMQDKMYYGPEAMCLYGPNNFCAVWN